MVLQPPSRPDTTYLRNLSLLGCDRVPPGNWFSNPLTQRHIQVDLNPQLHHCKNLKPQSFILFWSFNDRILIPY